MLTDEEKSTLTDHDYWEMDVRLGKANYAFNILTQ